MIRVAYLVICLTGLHPPHHYRLRHQTPRKIKSGEVKKWRLMAEVEVINGIGSDIIEGNFNVTLLISLTRTLVYRPIAVLIGYRVSGYILRMTTRAVHGTHELEPHATPSPRSGAVTKRAT